MSPCHLFPMNISYMYIQLLVCALNWTDLTSEGDAVHVLSAFSLSLREWG